MGQPVATFPFYFNTIVNDIRLDQLDKISAKSTAHTPPTTPPTIAPVWLELDVDFVEGFAAVVVDDAALDVAVLDVAMDDVAVG